MIVRAFGRTWLTGRQAKAFLNAQKSDHTELKKEAEEFIAEFKARRAREKVNEKMNR